MEKVHQHGLCTTGRRLCFYAIAIVDELFRLVGMDVICNGDFSITNLNGRTWMSFRIPSCAAIDYVAEATKLTYAGVKPNDLCPCGSGKKYKRCHRP